jgi:hypothetical protein
MNLTYALTLEDMLAFQNYCGKHISEAKKGRFNLRVLPSFIVIAFVTMMTVNNGNFISIAAFIVFIAVLYITFFPIIYQYMITSNFKKQYKDGISENLSFTADEKGISVSSGKGKTELFWNAIRNIVTTDDLVLFFYTPVCAIILPKKAFENENHYSEFAQHIQQYHTALTVPGAK